MHPVPQVRIRALNGAPVKPKGAFVLYWMTAARRLTYNFALDRAAGLACQLAKPLLILETLTVDYPWSSPRHHRFLLDGMRSNSRMADKFGLRYYPYAESSSGQSRALVLTLAAKSAVTITDEFPIRHHRRLVETAAEESRVRVEAVDANGLLPLRTTNRIFTTASSFRRFLQSALPGCLLESPSPQPVARLDRSLRAAIIPAEVTHRWPPTSCDVLSAGPDFLSSLPLSSSVGVAPNEGGSPAAGQTLADFLRRKLARYESDRNEPDLDATSGLSSYLHHGHISVHQIFEAVADSEDWTISSISNRSTGSKSGWWGMSASAEAFLDELVTWRELGYNMSMNSDVYDQYQSLPQWAAQTLNYHARDVRPNCYELQQFEAGVTHDTLWNAAQGQLVREGRIHNYLRMLWGKKILEWTRSPEEAAEIMIELNNKYALDGNNPNSYSGIFWVLGRYDRPWGPERAIFGKVRYMSSQNTVRKVSIREYVKRYS